MMNIRVDPYQNLFLEWTMRTHQTQVPQCNQFSTTVYLPIPLTLKLILMNISKMNIPLGLMYRHRVDIVTDQYRGFNQDILKTLM